VDVEQALAIEQAKASMAHESVMRDREQPRARLCVRREPSCIGCQP
jgi:hypothetical protein